MKNNDYIGEVYMKRIFLAIILLIGLISFPSKITGPRYRIEGYLSRRYYKAADNNDINNDYINIGLGFYSEFKTQINKKFDISFGPKVVVNTFLNFNDNEKSLTFSINPGLKLDFNYEVSEEVKAYLGLETAISSGISIIKSNFGVTIKKSNKSSEEKYYGILFPNIVVGKISIGTKIKEKYNVGFYAESRYRRGIFAGIEAGYTF
ncbi:hypothetical protein [Streptobacillus moniliformis]|uniref:hypothetical protein n=1 Tax=Streptobacillus moniliformis TaxID=34105 RepID=UPI0007E3C3EE|nr:hypothetical protein [Streptobacillus moniliformis]